MENYIPGGLYNMRHITLLSIVNLLQKQKRLIGKKER